MMLATAALLLFVAQASAQVCNDSDASSGGGGGGGAGGSGGSSQYTVNCDMTYKNTELMCDTFTVRGSCPAEPMMMKQTPSHSLIKEYSPYLYAYARDPEERARPYTGPYYRGTPGDASQTFGLVCPPGRNCPASCSAQLKFPSEARSPEEEAKMVRLQLDNCANQYILNSARFPQQKEGSSLLCGEDSADGSKRCTLKSSCQPLKTVLETTNDYFPTAYLRAAWIKVMQDPSYRMNRRAALEPHLPSNIRIENPIPPPTSFEDVRLSQIGSVPYEEINDPTHPFSPRWDFEYNERDRFSPLTKGYGGDEKNEVFCAGDKDEQILKVDVLRFRDDRLDFSDKVTQRITWNQNCKDNSGMQANPCCMIQDYYNCKLLPCSQCYGMTDSSPVCSTDYVRTPDRKKVKVPYLPVHPLLRLASGGATSMSSAMSAMSLGNMGAAMSGVMGGAMNISQATGMLGSMSSMMGSISSLNSLGSLGSLGSLQGLNLGQAMPMLGIQSNILNGIPSNINAASLGSLLGTQTNLLGNLSGNLSMGQIQGIFSGQNSALRALGGAVGLPTNQIMQALSSPRGLLNTVSANTPLGDLTRDLRQQMNMLERFSNMSVGQAANQLGFDLRAIERLAGSTTIEQAAAQGIRLAGGLPGNMTIADARRIMNSAQSGMLGFDAGANMASFNRVVNPQINNLLSLPSGLNAGQAQAMLGGVQDILRTPGNMLGQVGSSINSASSLLGSTGVLNASDLNAASSALTANLGGMNAIVNQMNGLAGGLGGAGVNIESLRNIMGAQNGLLNSLGGSMNLSQISGALGSQLGMLGSLSQNMPLSQVQGMFNSQLGALSGLSGSLNLSSVAGGIDNRLLSNVMGANGAFNLTSIQGLDLSRLAGQLPTGQLRGVLNSIPGLSSGTISNVLNGRMSLSSIPGINGALANVPNINNILSSGVPGLSSALSGMGGMGGLGGASGGGGSSSSTLNTYVVLAFMAAMAPDPRTAKCNPNEFGPHNKPSMSQLCRELRAPFAPLNKLKMRYHNPEEEDKIVLKDGVPEGYSFRDYFKPDQQDQATHMPYPRLWDTGRSIQQSASKDQDPKDDSGQWTSIVGIGHEASAGDNESESGDSREEKAKSQRMKDQRCLFGGWGGNVSMGGVSIQVPDPVTSWTELKLYQARTTRDFGLVCMARYDKTYKTGATEDRALLGFGADPTEGIITKTNSDGTTTYTSVGKWLKDNPDSNEGITDIVQQRQTNFPLAWRGYLSANDDDQKFPNFPEGSGSTITGLDDAQPGDIIIMPYGASGENATGKRGLPRLALVTREMEKGSWIKVMEADNGKWPDVCGTTDGWGELKTRYLYKDSVPEEAKNEYERIKSTDDCADSHLSQCVAKNWDDLKIYRPTGDIREGNDGSELKEPTR